MMISDRTYDEAASWLVRQDDDGMDWDAFTLWLEADPAHRRAFDELASLDSQLDRLSQQLRVSEGLRLPSHHAPSLRWRKWAGFGGGAIAAGIALVLAFQPSRRAVPIQSYHSAAGKTVGITLAEGGRVLLAPASQLTVQGEHISLQGTAFFDVPHRPGREVTVSAGDFTVVDIGTRFSIANETGGLVVEVAQGSLSVSSDRLTKPIRLAEGQELQADKSSTAVRLIAVDPQQVASWRTGKLQFDQVPLAMVARDISRYSGEEITVDPAIGGEPFSGVIAIDHGEAPVRTLADILSLDIEQVHGGFRLEPRHR